MITGTERNLLFVQLFSYYIDFLSYVSLRNNNNNNTYIILFLWRKYYLNTDPLRIKYVRRNLNVWIVTDLAVSVTQSKLCVICLKVK
jgi:hypothetical protein